MEYNLQKVLNPYAVYLKPTQCWNQLFFHLKNLQVWIKIFVYFCPCFSWLRRQIQKNIAKTCVREYNTCFFLDLCFQVWHLELINSHFEFILYMVWEIFLIFFFYIWNLSNKTNEWPYQTETDSDTENTLVVANRKKGE